MFRESDNDGLAGVLSHRYCKSTSNQVNRHNVYTSVGELWPTYGAILFLFGGVTSYRVITSVLV